MIVPALVALQIAAAPPLVVRDARSTVRVPTTATASGAIVRLDALKPMLPVNVSHDSLAWYTIEVWGARMHVQAGVPSVRAGDDVYQLATAPRLENGRLVVPVQLVSDVFPDVVPNVRWDADAKQLVVFSVDAATRANLRTDAALVFGRERELMAAVQVDLVSLQTAPAAEEDGIAPQLERYAVHAP